MERGPYGPLSTGTSSVRVEALLADQGDEPTGAEIGTPQLLATALEDRQQIGLPGGDWDDEAAAVGELTEQGARRRRRGGVDGDRLKRRPLGQAAAAVADEQLDVLDPERGQGATRLGGQRVVTLDAGHGRRELGEDGSRVARAGTDLEHPLGAVQPQRLADRGDDPGLEIVCPAPIGSAESA